MKKQVLSMLGAGLVIFGTFSTAEATTLTIHDDFNDNVIDQSLWVTGGNTVVERDGFLNIRVDRTDHGGGASTQPFVGLDSFTLQVDHIMHAGSGFYFPAIVFNSYDKNGQYLSGASVVWQRSSHTPDNCYNSANYNKILVNTSQGRCYEVTNFDSSDYYDQWMTSIISFDTLTGIFNVDIEGDGNIDISSVLPEEVWNPVTSIGFGTYGWWTGHYHNIDNFTLTGEYSTDDPSTPTPEPATMLLFGTGLAGLAGAKLRRKRKSNQRDEA